MSALSWEVARLDTCMTTSRPSRSSSLMSKFRKSKVCLALSNFAQPNLEAPDTSLCSCQAIQPSFPGQLYRARLIPHRRGWWSSYGEHGHSRYRQRAPTYRPRLRIPCYVRLFSHTISGAIVEARNIYKTRLKQPSCHSHSNFIHSIQFDSFYDHYTMRFDTD